MLQMDKERPYFARKQTNRLRESVTAFNFSPVCKRITAKRRKRGIGNSEGGGSRGLSVDAACNFAMTRCVKPSASLGKANKPSNEANRVQYYNSLTTRICE